LYAGDTDSKEISSDQQLIIEQLKRNKQTVYKDILITTMLKLGYEISGEMAESIDKLYTKPLKEYSLSKLKIKNGI
jgi:hypothetical protein